MSDTVTEETTMNQTLSVRGEPAYVFAAMGTMVSVRSLEPLSERAKAAVRRPFADLEDRFSLYRPASEASRVAAGGLAVADASPEYRHVYDRAIGWRVRTMGAFQPMRPDGSVDLNGIVKALAVHRAGAMLTAAGVANWCLNAGGDVLVAGCQADGGDWIVGVVDPADRTALVSQVSVTAPHRAVATSGYAERGDHVWRTGAADFAQVTVAANDIVTADVLATAILSGGVAALESMQRQYPVEVLAIGVQDAAGAEPTCWASPGFRGA